MVTGFCRSKLREKQVRVLNFPPLVLNNPFSHLPRCMEPSQPPSPIIALTRSRRCRPSENSHPTYQPSVGNLKDLLDRARSKRLRKESAIRKNRGQNSPGRISLTSRYPPPGERPDRHHRRVPTPTSTPGRQSRDPKLPNSSLTSPTTATRHRYPHTSHSIHS